MDPQTELPRAHEPPDPVPALLIKRARKLPKPCQRDLEDFVA